MIFNPKSKRLQYYFCTPFCLTKCCSKCMLKDVNKVVNQFIFPVGLTAVIGQCFPGHYCPVGSIHATQEQCTVGNYCELGTEYPTPCPNGTFSNTPGLTMDLECTDCTQGYYCNGVGLTAVSGDCKQGNILLYDSDCQNYSLMI